MQASRGEDFFFSVLFPRVLEQHLVRSRYSTYEMYESVGKLKLKFTSTVIFLWDELLPLFGS